MDDRQFCARSPENRSPCLGDSGGPFATGDNDKFYVLGIISMVQRDPACQGISIYTRVSAYLDWIEQETGISPQD